MTALPPIGPVHPHVVRVTAPLLLGGLWNWCLFGVLLVQFYVYSYNFSKDRMILKLLVGAIFLLETTQTALNCVDLFRWFASGYGDISHLVSPSFSSFDGPIIEAVVALIVQSFYAYRIWALSKKRFWWLCLLICLLAILDAGAGITGSIYARVHNRFISGRHPKIIVITWLAINVIVDILIASAMVYYLTRKRRENDGLFSSPVLVRMVRLTVESNLLTTSMGIVSLVLVVIFPNENWYTCPTAILSKLYSHTLLLSLNSRIWIRSTTSAQVTNRNLARTLAATPPTPRVDSRAYITFMEIEKPPSSYKSLGVFKGCCAWRAIRSPCRIAIGAKK